MRLPPAPSCALPTCNTDDMVDHEHCGLLRVNHLNLHDLPPRIKNSDVILPMTTVASAGALLIKRIDSTS